MQWSLIIVLVVAFAGLFAGCKPRHEETPSELWLRWHFAGTGALTNHATKLPAFAALPASQELGDALSKRIFTALPRWLAAATNSTVPDCADLLQPLLNLAVQREHLLEIHGEDGTPKTWVLAVNIEKEQVEKMGMDMRHLKDEARLWEKNYLELVARLGLPKPKRFNLRYCGGWYATRADRTCFDFLEMGRWVILGFGPHRQPMLDVLERVNKTGAVAEKLGENWARLEADFTRLSPALKLPVETWQHADFSVAPRGENLVVNGSVMLAADAAMQLPEWTVPTNLIRDPLISFTASRGTDRWLGASELLGRAGFGGETAQAFAWAQAQIPFHSYAAISLSNGPAAIQSLGTAGPEFVRSNLIHGERGRFEVNPAGNEVAWKGLPIVAPLLRATNDVGRDFLLLTLFPGRPQSQPIPAELLTQLNRAGLVYYDWEITGERLAQWRQLLQLWNVVMLRSLPQPAIAQQKWIEAATPLLGNTVTEVTLRSARELAFTRKGHVGLTGFEIAWLAAVLDGFIAGPLPERPLPALPVPSAPPAPK